MLICVKPLRQIDIVHIDMSYAAHRGLHHLGSIGIGSVVAAHDMAYAKPVSHTDDGAQIAWVLHCIERQTQLWSKHCFCLFGQGEQCKHPLRMLQAADGSELPLIDDVRLYGKLTTIGGLGDKKAQGSIALRNGADHLHALGNKESMAPTIFALGKRTDEFLIVIGQHELFVVCYSFLHLLYEPLQLLFGGEVAIVEGDGIVSLAQWRHFARSVNAVAL